MTDEEKREEVRHYALEGETGCFKLKCHDAALKQLIISSIERLSKAAPSNVQEVAASQLQLMAVYHEMALAQSRRSFFWALIGAGAGLIFFIVAVCFVIQTGDAVTAVIPAISGAVVEVVAGIVFFLYSKATVQLWEFHSRLDALQRYLLANSICEGLEGEDRKKARAELIREIARGT